MCKALDVNNVKNAVPVYSIVLLQKYNPNVKMSRS